MIIDRRYADKPNGFVLIHPDGCRCSDCRTHWQIERNRRSSRLLDELQNSNEKAVQILKNEKESEMDANEKLAEASQELSRAAQDLRNAADALNATARSFRLGEYPKPADKQDKPPVVELGKVTEGEIDNMLKLLDDCVSAGESRRSTMLRVLSLFAKWRGLV